MSAPPPSHRAVALAAGGARGAFQAGALLAFAEAGVRFAAVAGSSIGSVNGAFLAQGDGSPAHLERLCSIWRSLPEAALLRLHPGMWRHAAALLGGLGAPVVAKMAAELVVGELALLDPAPLARVLDRHIDYDRVRASSTRLTIALLPQLTPLTDAVTGRWRTASYVDAHALRPHEVRAALLAAVAIPMAFPSRQVHAKRHGDAGLADPVPVRALYERGARRIVAISLSARTPSEDRAALPGVALLQVRPPPRVDDTLPSVFDFSRSTIERLITLGHEEARAALAESRPLADALVALHDKGRANQALAGSLPRRR